MNRIVSGFSLRTVLRSSRARQTGVLYISLVASLALGIIVSVINTRFMGPKAFGDFKFIQTIWSLSVIFMTLGLFTTGGNLLALKKTPAEEKPLLGGLLLIAIGMSLVFMFLMIGLSFPIGLVYGDVIGSKIRLYSSLLFVFPMQLYLQEALRGTNDIYGLAWLNALPQLLYIPAALLVNKEYGFSLDSALLLFLLGIAVTVVIIALRSKPRFTDIKRDIGEIFHENRNLGFHVYVALLITTATAQLSQFTLAYFFDTRLVGMFALALTITMPLTMIPNAIATTFFKHFASLDRIPKKVIVAASLLSVASCVLFILVIKKIVVILYTESFLEMVTLAHICAFGSTIHGIADIYNRYLLSHGETRKLRNNAMHLGVISILGYVFLVFWLGAIGAALTKLIVDVFYFIIMLVYYKEKISSRSSANNAA
jgi:O-antigen/teichoic acid export membrane protein